MFFSRGRVKTRRNLWKTWIESMWGRLRVAQSHGRVGSGCEMGQVDKHLVEVYFYLSAWLGCGAQWFGQVWVSMSLWKYFADVTDIYNQLTQCRGDCPLLWGWDSSNHFKASRSKPDISQKRRNSDSRLPESLACWSVLQILDSGPQHQHLPENLAYCPAFWISYLPA